MYDEIVKRVNQIIDVKRANPQANIAKTENRIDQIVYKLYGLTKIEIETVEKSVKDK